MKCEIIRDLLPLYIDGLTSKESNQEIEKHLKNCEECQKYYQEIRHIRWSVCFVGSSYGSWFSLDTWRSNV